MTDTCPICAKTFKLDDICASDITEGTCHAECLKGAAVVDLDTGDDLPDGKIETYPYTDVMDPTPETNVSGNPITWALFHVDAEGKRSMADWRLFPSKEAADAGIGQQPEYCRAETVALGLAPAPISSSMGPADQIIGEIEELFPNWRSYRDLVDCITCELHDLRKRAEGQING